MNMIYVYYNKGISQRQFSVERIPSVCVHVYRIDIIWKLKFNIFVFRLSLIHSPSILMSFVFSPHHLPCFNCDFFFGVCVSLSTSSTSNPKTWRPMGCDWIARCRHFRLLLYFIVSHRQRFRCRGNAKAIAQIWSTDSPKWPVSVQAYAFRCQLNRNYCHGDRLNSIHTLDLNQCRTT